MTPELPALTHGKHTRPSDGLCLLEAAAWLAGEPHSDHPTCVSTVLAAHGRALNDALLPSRADLEPRLRALTPRLVGTAGRPDLDQQAGLACADWLVRVYTPTWLRLAGLTTHADDLSGLAPLASWDAIVAAQPRLDAAGAAARNAAGAAARNAAGAAARNAARDAARDAAGAAAWAAAWAAARDAAGAAARNAAGAAARDAAGAAARNAAGAARSRLAPTVAELQESGLALFERNVALWEVERG